MNADFVVRRDIGVRGRRLRRSGRTLVDSLNYYSYACDERFKWSPVSDLARSISFHYAAMMYSANALWY